MKSFLLKQTTDGMNHLYLDDSDRKDFVWLCQAAKVEILQQKTLIALYHKQDTSYTKVLFGIAQDNVFQVTLPENSKITTFRENCVFEIDGQYYTMEFNHGTWEKRLLGKLCETFLSYPDNIRYNRIRWIYFLRDVETCVAIKELRRVELTHFVNGQIVVLGTYLSVQEYAEKIFALYPSGGYAIFNPDSLESLKGETYEALEALNGVFIWSNTHNKYFFHYNYKLFGKNTIYTTYQSNNSIQLFHINGEKRDLIAEGHWHWKEKNLIMCIEEMEYSLNIETKLVDFKNPRPTRKKCIKDFFRLK